MADPQFMVAGLDRFDESPPNPTLLAATPHKFKGRPLYPYALGRRLILREAFSKNKAPTSVWTCAFILLLTMPEEEATPFLFEPQAFLDRVPDFIRSLSTDDYNEAVAVSDKILGEINAAKVETEDRPPDPLKKNP